MAATLPNELLQQILADLLRFEPLPARAQHRRAFSKVCPTWRASLLDRWCEIALSNPDQVDALSDLIEDGSTRTVVDGDLVGIERAVQSVSFGLELKSARYGKTQLRRLLGKFSGMKRVEMFGGAEGSLEGQMELVDLLSLVRGIKHLALDAVRLKGLNLSALVREWRTLESVSLTNCALVSSSTLLRSAFTHLRTVHLTISQDAGEHAHLIRSLPPSVQTLSLDHRKLWSHPVLADQLEVALQQLAPQLREYELGNAESMEGAWMIETSGQHAKTFQVMLPRLVRIEKLTLPLCTISKLKQSLGALGSLVQLNLLAVEGESGAGFAASDLLGIISQAPPLLECLTIDAFVHRSWSRVEQDLVRALAQERSLILTTV